MSDAKTLTTKTSFDLREDLHDMIVRDLLGPAGGADEELHHREQRVRDRYLVGVLAPRRAEDEGAGEGAADEDGVDEDGVDEGEIGRSVDASMQDKLGRDIQDSNEEGSSDDSAPVKDSFFPSSMGLSFVVDSAVTEVVVEASWGQYWRVTSETQERRDGKAAKVWKRQPVRPPPLPLPLAEGTVEAKQLHEDFPDVTLQGKMRHHEGIGWIVSVFMVNGGLEPRINKDRAWVFQPHLRVRASDDAAEPAILVRRSLNSARSNLAFMDPLNAQEASALDMQYRHRLDFAVGHGVSVHVERDAVDRSRARSIETTFVPSHDVAQQTPPNTDDVGELAGITLDMRELAEMPKADLLANLQQIVTAYGHWIGREEAKLGEPTERLSDPDNDSGNNARDDHREAFREVIKNCNEAKARIQAGIDCLDHDDDALAAFRFTNQAMALQRLHTVFSGLVRRGAMTPNDPLDAVDEPKNRSWRLFQLAFILLNLPSITDPHHSERSQDPSAIADLLWFPTGGGKTEAYLGLTTFTLAMRRLRPKLGGYDAEHGVGVLMRYTLRLLTLQQFQRAAALMCACEALRRDDPATWGKTPFRLGLWVGSSSTPNTLREANDALKAGRTNTRPTGGGNPKQLTHCPWCGRELKDKNVQVYHGKNSIGRCVTYCSDTYGTCAFSEKKAPYEGLPVLVVDEDIYRHPPDLLIATVDKFAQMPWKGEMQMLFGRVSGRCERHGFLSPDIEADDQHGCKGNHPKAGRLSRVSRQDHPKLRPPDLIIQDELHLISGPLGSMVGLYETAIDDLSTWHCGGKAVRPKVIASTATVRRAPDQVKRLFVRDVRVFPPQGSSVEDNFFSLERSPSRDHPGRRYLGICAFGRRFTEALIRVYIACLGSGQTLYEQHDTAADSYMTLVGYFNSIRELAGAKRLSEDDIRARLRGDINERRGFEKRNLDRVEELTSRKSSQKIPGLLSLLEAGFSKAGAAARQASRGRKRGKQAGPESNPLTTQQDESAPPPPKPFDVVLATNMISVGVDIDRLGLMVVAGQPKNTAEYIQATSRVGRSKAGPGLVITLYNWARPRDLSHFEAFEHYHLTFYKHVEALSVTPFASRALDRGLAGVMTGMVRLHDTGLSANEGAQELENDSETMAHVLDVLAQRAENVTDDKAVRDAVLNMLERKREHWLRAVHQQRETKLLYRQRGSRKQGEENAVALLKDIQDAPRDPFAAMNSLRNVEPTIKLILDQNSRGLDMRDTNIFSTDEGES